MRRFLVFFFTAVVVAASQCAAFAKPVITLKLSGAYVTRSADGKEQLVPVSARAAQPGEHIRWEIVATNSGDQPARNFVPSGKISPATTYVANSGAAANAAVEFSLDSGKTWSSTPTVTVHSGDTVKTVNADLSTYTAIRWRTAAPLAPGASHRYVYEVVVR
ncbi:MAG: hypothetical protein ABSB70_17365 [Candidatus Velthaea sp.]|jgi:uncharacterized repeat protein (TIGR01451 family)